MSKHRFIRMEEIVHIAIEMGIVADAGYVEREIDVNDIVSFAKRIETVARADEREECAKVCDEVEDQAWAQWKAAYKPIDQGRSIGAEECAVAIRARKA